MNRVNIQQAQPEAYKAMFGLEGYLASSSLAGNIQELVRLHASQINGCQFCITMHTDAALKQGETPQRLEALTCWSTSELFNEQEQAILAVTEAMTLIADQGLSDELYANIARFLTEHEIAQLIMLIAAINAWNRIGIATSA